MDLQHRVMQCYHTMVPTTMVHTQIAMAATAMDLQQLD